jgi:hypothetical protein
MHRRAIKIIQEQIEWLKLDLSRQVVLTEIGSNAYLYLPIIAAKAGAKKVYAVTFDSEYGKADNLKNECLSVAKKMSVADTIQVYTNHIPFHVLSQITILTNSGFLRPINQSILKHCNSNLVIPLMFEAWELRSYDIDIQYCKSHNIKVAGVNEKHERVDAFNYVGMLALKLAFEAGFEVYRNNIFVWSNDDFGRVCTKAFQNAGARNVFQNNSIKQLYDKLPNIDFIFICSYDEEKEYFSENGLFDVEYFLKKNKSPAIIHLYGNIDYDFLSKKGFLVYPPQNGKPKVMSKTLAYLGLQPVLSLHAAGLRTAQEMINNTESELTQRIV